MQVNKIKAQLLILLIHERILTRKLEVFQGKVFIGFPPRGLKPAKAHEVGRAIPRDLAEAVKLARNLWDRCADNGLFQVREEGVLEQTIDPCLLTWSRDDRKTVIMTAPTRITNRMPCGYSPSSAFSSSLAG